MALRWSIALSILLCGSVVRAQTEDRPLRLSTLVGTAPGAALRSGINEPASHVGPDRALAAKVAVDYSCGEVLFLGLDSQYVFWVRGALSEGPSDGSEIDFRVRIGAISRLTEAWHLFAYLAPGYSILAPSWAGGTTEPRGLVVGGTLGAAVDLMPALFFSGELGYQEGFQTGDNRGVAFDYATRFMHVGVGLGIRLL